MSIVKAGDSIKVHYTGTLNDGSIFDSSKGREPLAATLGQGMLIPGFEEALIGMKVGEIKKTTIIAEEAYGPRREEMTAKVERSNLPPDLNPQIGEQLQMQRPDGQVMVVTVIASDDATITIDANHPMAGKDLTFELELIEIG